MTYRMGDSINPASIPQGLDAYAGYNGGTWPDYTAMVTMFPGAKHLAIAVAARFAGDCLDIERYDATPADAPAWLASWQRGNTPLPVLYTNAANVQTVIDSAGRSRDQYLIWSAHYTNTPHICGPSTCGYPQADATQWTDHGGVWDESLVNDYFFNDPPPGGTVARQALPASALPVKEVCEGWAPDHSQWDVVMLGADGHVYHIWYAVGAGWNGPEDLVKAG